MSCFGTVHGADTSERSWGGPRRRVTFQVEVTQACSTAEDGGLAEQRPGRRERVAEKVPRPHGGGAQEKGKHTGGAGARGGRLRGCGEQRLLLGSLSRGRRKGWEGSWSLLTSGTIWGSRSWRQGEWPKADLRGSAQKEGERGD